MPQTIHEFRCPSCGKTLGTLALANLAKSPTPQCPKCGTTFDPNAVRQAANVKHDEAKGPFLLPVVFLSLFAHIGLPIYLANNIPPLAPLYSIVVIVCAVAFTAIYSKKGGSGLTCAIMTILFGPISGAFLALVGSWKS